MFIKKNIYYLLCLFFLLTCCKNIHNIHNKNTKNHGVLINKSKLNPEFGLENSSKEYLIKYSSISGLDGTTKREDTAVLFLPKGKTPKNGWPLIVWTHGTVGINNKCAPSVNKRNTRDRKYLNTWISLGFAVLAPDYPGLGSSGQHPYLNSRSEAFSVLDAISALINNFSINDKQIFLSGQSQGAHASFSASIYQPSYAPDIKIKYVILTGVPYFNKNFFARNSLSTSSNYKSISYAIYLFLSAKQINNKLIKENYFDEKIIPYVDMGDKLCLLELYKKISQSNLKTNKLLKPKFKEIISMPIFKFKNLKVKQPIFVGSGTNDFDTTLNVQRAFVNDLLKAGTYVKQVEYYKLNHNETLNASLRDSVPLVLKSLKK